MNTSSPKAGASEAVKYVFDLRADLGADLKPIVFGEWSSNARDFNLLGEVNANTQAVGYGILIRR